MKYRGLESSKLEFKEHLPKSDQVIKTAVAFSNARGGKIVVGVSDNGEIKGISDQIAHEALEWLDQSIYEACAPPIIPLIYLQRIDDSVLLIIEIAAGTNKPYYIKSRGLEKGAYLRLGRSTVRANADMIEELKWQSRGLSYDELPIYHSSPDDLELSAVERFLQTRRNGAKARVTDDVLLSYHALKREHSQLYATVGGLLLFGRDPQVHLSEAYLLCSHFSGIEGRKALASRAIKGTLFEQFDAGYDFIVEHLNRSFEIVGKKRNERLELPPEAIRESLMNAILHRNYHINAPIKVAIYADRIEIFSPGSLAGPIELEDLESGITYVRNTAIAKVLWEAEYIEKRGSGFTEIFRSYREYMLSPPLVNEGANFVKVLLPRGVVAKGSVSDEERILGLFRLASEITIGDIVKKLSIPKTTAGRAITSLVRENKLIRAGSGRATHYKQGPAFNDKGPPAT